MIEKMTRREFSRALDRRTFLKACAALGVGAAAGGTLQYFLKAGTVDAGGPGQSETRLAMGTYVTVTAVHDSRDQADEAIAAAFDEMDRLIGILSRHRPSTALSVLNATGRLSNPPPELVDVLKHAVHLQGVTGGAFDVTVGPIIDLLERAPGLRLPTENEIADALQRVGSDKLIVTTNSVRFRTRDMSVTLDGIAKGYVVDRMADVLASHDIASHLVNAGGDIRTSGKNKHGHPWTIAIEDPEKMRQYPDVIKLNTGAVATSGNYEVYYDDEKVFHHIVNPHSGQSPHDCTSATVRTDTAIEADALSTATFVLGPNAGVRFIDQLGDRQCLLVSSDGQIFRSRGWALANSV